MALETMKDVRLIGGVEVCKFDKHSSTNWPNEYTNSTKTFINVDHVENIISFKLQDGPIKENGLNGCQVTDMVKVAKHIIERLNKKFPCVENEQTISSLENAISFQNARTLNREKRNVEGTNAK